MKTRPQPLNNGVYEALKRDILCMELSPGSVLCERAIAKEMDVSRTPVREALQRLESDGLVKRYPKLGAVVSELLLRDVAEAFQIREFIESPAAAIAAKVLTREQLAVVSETFERLEREQNGPEACLLHDEMDLLIHSLVINATGNSRLIGIMSSLDNVCRRARSIATPVWFRESIAEHRRLVEALERGDSAAAETAMRAHLVATKKRLIEIV